MLSVGMVATMAGCGQDAKKETPVSKEESKVVESTPTSEVEKPKEPVVLEWYYRGNGQQEDTEKVEAEVNKLLKEYPGLEHVSININCFVADEYNQQIILAQSSGAQMDIINSVSINFWDNVADGTWMPLNDYMSDELKNELPQWLWDTVTKDGNIYMVPSYTSAFNSGYMFFPKAYMDKYGNEAEMRSVLQDPNKSLKEKAACLEEYLYAVRKGEGDTKYLTGFDNHASGYGSNGYAFDDIYESLGAGFIIPYGETEVATLWESDFYKEYCEIYADWFEKGIFSPDGIDTKSANYGGAHILDQTSYVYEFMAGYGSEEYMAKRQMGANGGIEGVVIKVQYDDYIKREWTAGNGISSTCKHPEEAALFLEAITTGNEIGKKIYNTMVWGLEGEHWKWIDKATERIETLEYSGLQGNTSTTYAGLKWILGNTFHGYKNQYVTDDEGQVAVDAMESPDAISSPFSGFVLDNSAVQVNIDQINAVITEYREIFKRGVSGADWEKTYDEFINKLNVAGMQDVKAEYQKQLDAFLKK